MQHAVAKKLGRLLTLGTSFALAQYSQSFPPGLTTAGRVIRDRASVVA